MLFRLLLTLSLVGAWSLPALGSVFDTMLPGPSAKLVSMLRAIDFDKSESTEGGGTWRDSQGREGNYASLKSVAFKRVKVCPIGRIGCRSFAAFIRYSIELDDGRTESFKWVSTPVISAPTSASGDVEMKFVWKARSKERGTITIVDGSYTLTLVEEKIKGVPNSITYSTNPRSNLTPATIN